MATLPFPVVSADHMREADRIAVEDFGVTLLQMMENAGRAMANFVVERGDYARVIVLAGGGGNGGGGLAAARNLHNWGIPVHVALAKTEDDVSAATAHQLKTLHAIGVDTAYSPPAELPPTVAVIDALVGYSLNGPPRGRAAELIEWANAHAGPVFSLDVPSGVDATTGRAPGVRIQPDVTVTLAAPKAGVVAHGADVGELYLADISIPPEVWSKLGFGRSGYFYGAPTMRWNPGGDT